jgi:putative membrane protein
LHVTDTPPVSLYAGGMIVLATVMVTLAAALHIAIFFMESVTWTRPAVWRRFGLTDQAAAETTRPLAYNQGFYNLFLAIGAIVGLILYRVGTPGAGLALILFTMGSMLAAAVVLVTSGSGHLRSALIQGTLPLIGIVLMLLS